MNRTTKAASLADEAVHGYNATITDPLVTSKELAAMVRRPPGTIGQWRHNGYGPRGFRIGGRVVYRLSEVERWLAEQEQAARTDGAA